MFELIKVYAALLGMTASLSQALHAPFDVSILWRSLKQRM